jgi:hypothetical protein
MVGPRRAELLGGIRHLEHAIGFPISDPSWRPGMSRAVASLRAAFAEQISATEGPSGLYAGLLEGEPRLTRKLNALVDEQHTVLSSLDGLEFRLDTEVCDDDLRTQAAHVLEKVLRHRQHGADLVYEALSTDLGGET